jgi:hypothetical protein
MNSDFVAEEGSFTQAGLISKENYPNGIPIHLPTSRHAIATDALHPPPRRRPQPSSAQSFTK